MNDTENIFLNILEYNTFYFYVFDKNNKAISGLPFVLKSDSSNIKAISDNNGLVEFKNVNVGSYILLENFDKDYKKGFKYKVEVLKKEVIINKMYFKNFKIVYDILQDDRKYVIYYYFDDKKECYFEDSNIIIEDKLNDKKDFLYWCTDISGKGDIYYPKDIVNLENDLILYAIRKSPKPYDILYEENILKGKGEEDSEILIYLDNGTIITTHVNNENNWSIKIPNFIKSHSFEVFQIVNGKIKSEVVKLSFN